MMTNMPIILQQEHAFFLKNSFAQHVMHILTQSGIAYFVGGCVRQALMGVSSPNDDIDIATNIVPEKVKAIARKYGFSFCDKGADFGTIILYHQHCSVDVTCFRQEISHDGRHAQVVFTDDYLQDALRRDFTMNALYVDQKGMVFDPTTQGIQDCLQKNIRFIGHPKHRIHEDSLRILRYYRFLARYGMSKEQEKLHQDYQNIFQEERDFLRKTSRERNRAELEKIIQAPQGRQALGMMASDHMANFFFDDCFSIELYQQYHSFFPEEKFLMMNIFLLFFTQTPKQIQNALPVSRKEIKILTLLQSVVAEIKQIESFDLYEFLVRYETLEWHFLWACFIVTQKQAYIPEKIHEILKCHACPVFPKINGIHWNYIPIEQRQEIVKTHKIDFFKKYFLQYG